MRRSHPLTALAFLMLGSGTAAAAQEATVVPTGAAAEIGGRLRAFYFNLGHNDWDALTADILAAKVVAHRRPPERLLLAPLTPPGTASSPAEKVCPGAVAVEQAVITVEGDWAGASVPHCGPVSLHDEFRLIQFAGRWRFVSIHLSQQPVNVTAER